MLEITSLEDVLIRHDRDVSIALIFMLEITLRGNVDELQSVASQ